MDAPTTSTRDRMLLAARRLIAARGVDGVAIRDILKAAGAKNGGAIHYYFSTKEEMIRELLGMGARRIDERRIRMLEEQETSQKQLNLADLATILVESSIGVSKSAKGEDSFIRFALRVQDTHPALYDEAVDRWDVGLGRIVTHIRRALPGVRAEAADQRLMLALELIGSTLAKREAYLVDGIGDERWGRPQLLRALKDAVVSVLMSHEVPAKPKSGRR